MITIGVPTCLRRDQVADLLAEIRRTILEPYPIIATCQPISAAANRNLILEAADTPIVIMVDDDVSGFPMGWATDLANTLDATANCVMVSAQLVSPQGGPGFMMGGVPARSSGLSLPSPERKLPTACVAFRVTDLRFDENFVGSGFEDDDFCRQLLQREPEGTFLVNHDVQVVHVNEAKNQGGANWEMNKAYFRNKWRK